MVSFEGLPGAGKTTAIGMVVEGLKARGITVGVVDIETISNAPVLRPITRTYPPGHPSRIMLFWILRLQQYDMAQQMIADGVDLVIADRYWGSTLAFDVYGNRVPPEVVDWIGQYIKNPPDMTFFFDVPLEVVQKRRESTTIVDQEFAKRLEYGYQVLATNLRWVRIDATEEPSKVKQRCLEVILALL